MFFGIVELRKKKKMEDSQKITDQSHSDSSLSTVGGYGDF